MHHFVKVTPTCSLLGRCSVWTTCSPTLQEEFGNRANSAFCNHLGANSWPCWLGPKLWFGRTRGQFGKKKSACGNGDWNWVTLALFFSDRMSHLSNFRSANDFLLLLGSAMEVVKLFGSCVGCWPNDCFDQSDHHDWSWNLEGALLHAGLRDGNTLRII